MANILLVGAGNMGVEYAKVLQAQDIDFELLGRSEEGVKKFSKQYDDIKTHHGGIESYLDSHDAPEYAIVAVNVDQLYPLCKMLLEKGSKHILVEKPGSTDLVELEQLDSLKQEKGASVWVAYNRRFYQSVNKARELIAADGGISSVHFEFTEWIHTIDPQKYPKAALERWIISNSSHVIDLVFHLCGRPAKMDSQAGGDPIDWHPSGSLFTGSGITEKEIPFTYHSNWKTAGRWSVELSTQERKLILAPMEGLGTIKRGTVQRVEEELENTLDNEYKPGLYEQTRAFLESDPTESSCSLEEHLLNFSHYLKMGAY